jgi:hypothetical protein
VGLFFYLSIFPSLANLTKETPYYISCLIFSRNR